MRFWDSSAIIPLLIQEPQTANAVRFMEEDDACIVWTLTTTECLSALYRKERLDNTLSAGGINNFILRLRQLETSWTEVQQVSWVKKRAERLLAQHALRATDALQLAAALIACEERPEELPFVSFDDALAKAAIREGFPVLGST